MTNFFEKIVSKTESIWNPEQFRFGTIQAAEIELIERAGGEEIAGTWIDVNSAAFRQLIDDTRFDYIKRLGDEGTHDEALVEIEGKLTKINTVH